MFPIKTLRIKLLIGLMPLLAILVGVGLWATVMFYRLGGNIDVILRENYASVLAAQNMKESLERLDSSFLFAISGQETSAKAQYAEFLPVFEDNLRKEQRNVTLPGEQELADKLTELFDHYRSKAEQFYALPADPTAARKELYFQSLLPTFLLIKHDADAVLNLNQRNMEQMDRRARNAAAVSIRLMILTLIVAAAVAALVALALGRSVLEPIRSVTQGARALAQGDVDQVVPVLTHDELGELASTFNTMARTIRDYRNAGTARLVRAQQTAQATIDSFPDPVVVVDTSGAIERANPAARRVLGVSTTDDDTAPVRWEPPPILRPLLTEVLAGGPDQTLTGVEHAVAHREESGERFFLPRVLAIRSNRGSLLGAALVLQDVTRFRLLDELKSDMVSTVSHELKTPLTSVQMAVHLLLEEVVGPLNAKQIELLLAARQDSDRLLAMVNDLLDLTRIEQGRLKLDLRPTPTADLVNEAVGRFEARARDADVTLEAEVGADLPDVLADRERTGHVFDNLIGNALEHTGRGGRVRVAARADGGAVGFTVQDTGEGIAPEHLAHVFEKFYRVPSARKQGGAGLGLAIVREIVQAHGGKVEVASRPGEGSVFGFTLPTGPAGATPDEGDGRHP
jgi:signal transduction histidine kinase